ncbi:protein of unknown function [Prosthecobacter debontii]|uniref:YfiR family protein n=1 Tax=Prosthecobacter debontii TaxID=48467 RepID=A0A1T4YMY9_9BACT|nr:protein of unknown function [Prosthecobacter debontii]
MELLRTLAKRTHTQGVAILLLLAFVLSPFEAHAESSEKREYALKAVFLYNFCQFIDWPSGSFAHDRAPIIIGVMGSNPFGGLLSETVHGELIRGRSIQLSPCQNPQDALKCHLLFISDEEMPKMTALLSVLANHSVVTVGESEAFLEQGGMIALPSVENKIKLKVNLPAVRAAKVEMSSKLLRVADIKR